MSTLNNTEKFGYSLGDLASNIVFQVIMAYMIFFYTDVFGISAAAAGTLMLTVRLFDGLIDPVVGTLADRTKTRWGRYRPWLLWSALPYAGLAVLVFVTPPFAQSGKLIYAYITYALLMVAYTAINIPYSALGGVMTLDPQERASLQSWRMCAAMTGGVIVTATLLPMVDLFGGENKQAGFTWSMAVLALIALLCLLGCFALTKEKASQSTTRSDSIRDDLMAMLNNRQWWIIAIVTFLALIGIAMRGGSTAYYAQYYLGRKDLISLFLTAPMVVGFLGAVAAGVSTKFICKVFMMKVATVGLIVCSAALMLVPQSAVYAALALTCMANFFHMLLFPLLFSAVADTVDYGRKLNGKGGLGMSVAGHLLALKFGAALGGAATGWMLEAHGYVAGADQSAEALNGIVRTFAGGYTIAAVLMFIALHFYNLNKRWAEARDY